MPTQIRMTLRERREYLKIMQGRFLLRDKLGRIVCLNEMREVKEIWNLVDHIVDIPIAAPGKDEDIFPTLKAPSASRKGTGHLGNKVHGQEIGRQGYMLHPAVRVCRVSNGFVYWRVMMLASLVRVESTAAFGCIMFCNPSASEMSPWWQIVNQSAWGAKQA